MNRESAKHILDSYSTPKFKAGKTIISFSRQDEEDVNGIEKMKISDIKKEWKGLVWMNYIYGQICLNELQRISLLELEMIERKIKTEPLEKWMDKEQKKFDKQEEKNENI